MPRSKRGKPQRKRHTTPQNTARKPIAPLERARVTWHDVDTITGNDDTLYTLFYEYYRGYTIYSAEQGICCIHGRQGGCLRIEGKYACFPDIEQAKTMIKHFQADGRTSQESMKRYVPEDEYLCLNRDRQGHVRTVRDHLVEA